MHMARSIYTNLWLRTKNGKEICQLEFLGKKKFGTLHEFACHPCAGAMLIFSVSFQF